MNQDRVVDNGMGEDSIGCSESPHRAPHNPRLDGFQASERQLRLAQDLALQTEATASERAQQRELEVCAQLGNPGVPAHTL